ncbi:MAG: phosphoglucosamine mutase [Deltaproteobacteria bacterium CG_4_8_14_3_um_filter_45_9]|nr:MAG: phosphoglucosamine mutase [Deltaproteobacteria bacterium CG03_land_8_20_14_0_80_45_14]PIX24917.1 MAG: phosphoglucosamine mutase [Deltaproteobacteria bacterium CG_4_8_14_3_um_filter_45_9]
MTRKLFGTDGIRGVANVDPMTGEMAMQLGRAIAHIFKEVKGKHRIVVGKDTRLSGYMLETALASGICSMGADVMLVGPLPTPGIAFITTSMRANAGVVISASHNPYYDNGIKIFSQDGFKLPDEMEHRIEELILSNHLHSLRPTASEVGKAHRIDDAVGRYVVFLKNTFPNNLTLDGLRIALDCANGAAYRVAPTVLEELGAEVIPTGVEPNGENINENCGSLHPEAISRLVLEKGADIGMALDGDGDRIVFVDRKGKQVDGDYILAICALQMLSEKRLKKGTLVTTVMSNIGLDRTIKNAGGEVIRTQVGDRYVVEEMVRGDYNLGGEQSGHTIFLDYNTTCDGVLTALQVLAIMKRKERPLDELAKVMEPLPQVLYNVEVKEKKNLSAFPEIGKRIREIEKSLGQSGRILIRYSGTEPLLRIMVEGEDEAKLHRFAQDLVELIKKHIVA